MFNPLRIDPSEIKITDRREIRARFQAAASHYEKAKMAAEAVDAEVESAEEPEPELPCPVINDEMMELYRAGDSVRPRALPIIREVARKYGKSVEDIVGFSHKASDVRARNEAVFEVRRRCPHMSIPQIGNRFNRDHTTICYILSGSVRRRGKRA